MNTDFVIETTLKKYTGAQKEVIIPPEVQIIGTDAFAKNCNIENVVIPEGVTTIEDWAFYGCKSLQSVQLPNSITHIGEGAFEDCLSLTNINIPEHAELGSSAFSNCPMLADEDGFIIRNGILFDCMLDSCSVLQIPNGVKCINDFAEFPKDNLKTLILPDTLHRIGAYAFEDCYKLETVLLPKAILLIGEAAFCGCYSLSHINVPYFTKLGPHSFAGCYCLADEMGRIIVNDVFFESGPKSSPTLIIPEGVTRIDDGAEAWMNVETIQFPDSIRVIGKGAFSSCESLKNIDIPYLYNIFELNEIKLTNDESSSTKSIHMK